MEQLATDTSIAAYLAGRAKFPLGVICQSSGARDAFARTGESPASYIERHATGDWGNLDAKARQENERRNRRDIVSEYTISDGTTIVISTMEDRSKTFVYVLGERVEA